MENLGICADVTAGKVDMVSPLTLTATVGSLLSSAVVATAATCTLRAATSIEWALLDASLSTSNDNHTVMREIGNVLRDSDWCIEFKPTTAFVDQTRQKMDQEAEAAAAAAATSTASATTSVIMIPFQAELRYSNPNGDTLLRIITLQRAATVDRTEAEANVLSHVTAVSTIQQAARLAQQGNYQQARILLVSTQRMLQRTMRNRAHQEDYMSFIVQGEKLDQFMREAQAQQAVFGESQVERDDDASKSLYQMKSLSARTLKARA